MPKLEDLTIREAREISTLFGATQQRTQQSHSFEVGKAIFVRTVTHYYTGRVAVITDSDVGLDDACWIANTGRFADAMKNGIEKTPNAETEPYPDGLRLFLSRGAIVDFCEVKTAIPRSQK